MANHQSMLNSDPPESLGDADLLTTLLAAARVKQPRATANALLAEYGSFAEALGGATGMQEQATAYLATVRAAALRLLHGKLKDRPVLCSWAAVLDYLRAIMAFEPCEQFRVLSLIIPITAKDDIQGEAARAGILAAHDLRKILKLHLGPSCENVLRPSVTPSDAI